MVLLKSDIVVEGKMQAAVLYSPGKLVVEEVPIPLRLRSKDVLVKIMACGICGSDIERIMVTGTYKFPIIPGHEICGIVEKIGGEVKYLNRGDRVVVAPLLPCFDCDSCQRGDYGLCDKYSFLGSREDGGFAQFVRVPYKNVIVLPKSIGYKEAVAIEPASVVLHGLSKLCIKFGKTVAVVGCGSLGFFAIQFAKILGAMKVVAIDIDEEKLKLAKGIGSDECLNPSEQYMPDEIERITCNKGVDIVIETAGSNSSRELYMRIVKKKGDVLLFGSAHTDVS